MINTTDSAYQSNRFTDIDLAWHYRSENQVNGILLTNTIGNLATMNFQCEACAPVNDIEKQGKYIYLHIKKKYLRFRRPSRTVYTKSWNAKSTAGRVGKCDSVFGWAGTICNLIAPLFLSIKLSLADSPSTILWPIIRMNSFFQSELLNPMAELLCF